jgi:hypothetical protein
LACALLDAEVRLGELLDRWKLNKSRAQTGNLLPPVGMNNANRLNRWGYCHLSLFRHLLYLLTAESNFYVIRIMQLRDHPLLIRKSGFCSWPPIWTTTRHDRNDKPTGEVGVLEDTLMSSLINNKIFMFMQYRGFRYMGFLAFDDPVFCGQIYTLLKSNIGLSIKEIGDLDVSYTL